jgi:hypothetical protein
LDPARLVTETVAPSGTLLIVTGCVPPEMMLAQPLSASARTIVVAVNFKAFPPS